MEVAFTISIFLMCAFVILAMFDGLYLHLIRYKLYLHRESRNEHISHTVRAILFPLILYFFYLGTSDLAIYIGLAIIVTDIFVLCIDAYMEKNSRAFMGGLPQWEYILHLIVNGFHFASIAVFVVIKVKLESHRITLIHDFQNVPEFHLFKIIVKQLIPGGILMGLLHFSLLFPQTYTYI